MNSKRPNKEDVNVTKRRIPLHYQKRYMATFNNGSFNTSFVTAMYKQKIKTLMKNNKMLALALQNDRVDKEALLAESKANANLIMFSRLKFVSISEHLRAALTELDETVLLLKQHSSSCLSNLIPKNTMGSKEFKNLIKEVSMKSIPELDECSPLNLSTQQSNGYLFDISKQKKNLVKESHSMTNKKRKSNCSKVERKTNKVDAKIPKKSYPLQNMDNCLKENNIKAVSDEIVLKLSMENSKEKAKSNNKQNDQTGEIELIKSLPNMPIIQMPSENINLKNNFDHYEIKTSSLTNKNIQIINASHQYAHTTDIHEEYNINKKSKLKTVSKPKDMPNANYQHTNLTDVIDVSNVNKKSASVSISKPGDKPKEHHVCVNLIDFEQVSDLNKKSTPEAVLERTDMHKTNHQCAILTEVEQISELNKNYTSKAVSKVVNATLPCTDFSDIDQVSALDINSSSNTVSKPGISLDALTLDKCEIDKFIQPPVITNIDGLPTTDSLKYNENVLIRNNKKGDKVKSRSNILQSESNIDNSSSEARKDAIKQSNNKYVSFKHVALPHTKNNPLSIMNENVSNSTNKENQIKAIENCVESQGDCQIEEMTTHMPKENFTTNDTQTLPGVKTNTQKNIYIKEPRIILTDLFKNNKKPNKTVTWLDQKHREFINSGPQLNASVDESNSSIQMKEASNVECDCENHNGNCLFSVDEMEDNLSTLKRKSYRRHTTICYKEINLKKKLRR